LWPTRSRCRQGPGPPRRASRVRLGEETEDIWGKALAYRTLAEAYAILHPADPRKAEAAILEAIGLLEDVGAKPELARTYATYARLLKTAGDVEKAREYLTRAGEMFREMGMAGTWRE
jgi:tetratricopeptide (TPR) repeat protein